MISEKKVTSECNSYWGVDKIFDLIQKELGYINKLHEVFEAELKTLPDGYLCINKIRGKTRYYFRSGDGNSKYLPKSQRQLIRALLRKRFVKANLAVLRKNAKQLELCLKNRWQCGAAAASSILCGEYSVGYEEGGALAAREDWEKGPFDTNPCFRENLIHVTPRGDKVRSKSELLIASFLFARGISYRYEAALELGGKTVYPDFTIRRPVDGKIIYWEHFGMLKDEEYRRRAAEKLELYMAYGIMPGDNLIITCDGLEGELNVEAITAIIDSLAA